jgi:hypothetical protein
MPPIPDVVQFVIDVTQEVPANVSFWDSAFGVGPGRRQLGLAGRCLCLRSVLSAAWIPVDEAVRVSTCEAQFHNLSGSLGADIGDEILPRRRIRQHGDLVIRQAAQLCIRVCRFAVVARVEPGRFSTLRGFVFHVVPSSSASKYVACWRRPVRGYAPL